MPVQDSVNHCKYRLKPAFYTVNPILYSNLLYKLVQDFLDKYYYSHLSGWNLLDETGLLFHSEVNKIVSDPFSAEGAEEVWVVHPLEVGREVGPGIIWN